MIRKLFSITFLLAAVLVSCSKSDSPKVYPDGNGQAATPVKRPHGNPVGTAVVKTIGPAGGSIQSADGAIGVQVPAGALNAAVSFSIQQVQNTLEGSKGKAFRLLPEGAEFLKPVTITYAYGEQEMKGTIPDALYLAYQNQDGYHYLASQTELDEQANKLTVQTTHFSDWTIAELMTVVADTTQVKPGGVANLRLKWQLGSLLAPLTQDQPIGDLVDYDGYVSKVSWTLSSGKGSIQPDGIGCVYKAPGQVPAENPAVVSVSVPFTQYNNKRKSLAILLTSIYTVPDEYFILKEDGMTTINNPFADGESSLRMEVDSFFYVTTSFQSGSDILITIPGGVAGGGSYPYGTGDKLAYVDFSSVNSVDDSYISEKQNCETCDIVYSGGHVKITKYAAEIGDYMEGEFTAEVWLLGQYSPPKKNLSGKFRVKRTI